MAVCASCKAKVDEGAVRCLSCGATLSNPASFVQVSGWVLIALSSIPLGLGIVTEGEHNHVPLIVGGAVLAVGVLLMLMGRFRSKSEPPTTTVEEDTEEMLA